MTTIRLMRHLPLLRIDGDRYDVEIDGRPGALVALPFAEYDELTLGAFQDARRQYVETAPVFFVRELDRPISDDLTKTKFSSESVALDARSGLPVQTSFVGNDLDQFVRDTGLLRAAINLAAPRAAVPDPALSLGLVDVAAPPATFTMQGLADQELLFLSHAASAPMTASELERVRRAIDIVRRADGELGAAVRMLEAAADLALGPGEQLALCAITLEALLLPELKTDLRRAFTDRMTSLVGRSDDERQRVAVVAGAVYAARSTFVHGGANAGPHGYRPGMAQALLAQAVVALDAMTAAGESLDVLRAGLAAGRLSSVATGVDLSQLPMPPLEDLAPVEGPRLYPRKRGFPPATSSPDLPEVGADELVLFAPLIGLGLETLPQPLVDGGFPLTWISPRQLLTLEDPDIRRDWVSQLDWSQEPVAVIALRDDAASHDLHGYKNVDRSLGPLRRWRDAAVVALRLADHTRFDDPELLGDYVLYQRSFRCRLPSIYRQTIVRRQADPPGDRIAAVGNDDLRALWSLLLEYVCGPVSPAIENALTLFRRAHNLIGGQPSTKAQLLYATLDMVLGRPSGGESVDLLTRLAQVVPTDLASPLRWYAEHGHDVRNAVAHGYWDHTAPGPRGAEAIVQLRATIRVTLPAMLAAWLPRAADDVKPARAFRAALEASPSDLDWRQFLSRVPRDVQEQHRKRALAHRYSASDLPRMLQLASAARNGGDTDGARLWFTRAANAGSAMAMNALGVLEKQGQNFDAARRWYAAAAAGGEIEAVFNRSILEREAGNPDLARELCLEAAAGGSHKAMRTLGRLEEDAGHHDAASAWYERAAAAGSVNAMNDLGSIAAAAEDFDRARKWWETAVTMGHVVSARNLGVLAWRQGDLPAARKWFERAAAAGDGESAAHLAQLP